MMKSDANNELLPSSDHPADDMLWTSSITTMSHEATSTPHSSASLPEEDEPVSLVEEEPSEEEHLVVDEDAQAVAARSVIVPSPSSDANQLVPVSENRINREKEVLVADSSPPLSPTTTKSAIAMAAVVVTPDYALVKSNSEKVFTSEILQQQQSAAQASKQPTAKGMSASLIRTAAAAADAGAAGSTNNSGYMNPGFVTNFERLRRQYEASSSLSPAVNKKKTLPSPSSSPPLSSPKRIPRKSPNGNNSGKVNRNNDGNNHIVSAPPLTKTGFPFTLDETNSNNKNYINNNAQNATQLLKQEVARIEVALERKRLQQEIRIATEAHAQAANSAPVWSNLAVPPPTPPPTKKKEISTTTMPTTTMPTTLDGHFDNNGIATTATRTAAPNNFTTANNPYSKDDNSLSCDSRRIVDLDDSMSMTSSCSLQSTPGTDRARSTTNISNAAVAAVFSGVPPLTNEKTSSSLSAAAAPEAAVVVSVLDKNKLAAAATRTQQQTATATGASSSPRNKSSRRKPAQGHQHPGSNRSLRSGSNSNSSNRSIQSIPEQLLGEILGTPSPSRRATEGSALSSTIRPSTTAPTLTSANSSSSITRRPSAAGDSHLPSSPRNSQQQQQSQQGQKAATVPVVASSMMEGASPRQTELDTRKMELFKKREDLQCKIHDLSSHKRTSRQLAKAAEADPTFLVAMPSRDRGVDGTLAHAEEGQIKKNYSRDGSEIPDNDFVEIPDDVYNMFFLSNVGGQAFFYALYVFILKMALYTFLGMDAVQVPMPEDVERKVKVTQFLMLPVAVAMQDDLITTIFLVSNVKYWAGVKEKNPDASRWKWKLANVFRGIDGLFSLFINFVVLLKAEQVLGLFLNFAALQFLQNIDNMAVRLASDGYLTERLEQVAQNVKDCKLPRLHNEFLRTMDSLLFFFTFAVLLVAWSVINFA